MAWRLINAIGLAWIGCLSITILSDVSSDLTIHLDCLRDTVPASEWIGWIVGFGCAFVSSLRLALIEMKLVAPEYRA